ncbi:MAG: response regulator transcription factor [Butyrivibrio sp.]|uniref:response regulator transcription factor n=1 Tax=Butyrivibrio sp. TaxID=28121 RepID=UPI0025DC0F2D|nr:response regulator transcription factor [Butyrivibrio sp.]MCR5770620.1 response regulator transcription factor [Butyrivibrio sp.]
MVKILIIEDERPVRELIKLKLKDNYEIIEASDGLKAFDVLDHDHADLMIVDVMMPNMDGFEFVQELRTMGDNTPIIMLTAMDSFAHKKKGYNLGIDEYLTKPIDYEELTWHIEAILRRYKINTDKKIELGQFVISEDSMSASYNGTQIELTETEFKLLYKLLSYPGVIFTKQQLMDDIWGYDSDTDYRTIKVYVNRLRNKLSGCDEFEIVSARGVGYKAEIK